MIIVHVFQLIFILFNFSTNLAKAKGILLIWSGKIVLGLTLQPLHTSYRKN